MPCYLFTYHGHGTWMPDNPRGYVRRKEGILAPDTHMATCYRDNMCSAAICFDHEIQQILINAALEAFEHQPVRGHAVATESTHLHILVSWQTNRTWKIVCRQLRGSLSRKLNQEFERSEWFSKQPSRKRVADRQHFDHLMDVYLPRHSGLKWREGGGVYL
ncbi:transposase [Bythopirellula goksoeyrii]|nr:transposase [Bythopirellula goksoeyrii]